MAMVRTRVQFLSVTTAGCRQKSELLLLICDCHQVVQYIKFANTNIDTNTKTARLGLVFSFPCNYAGKVQCETEGNSRSEGNIYLKSKG